MTKWVIAGNHAQYKEYCIYRGNPTNIYEGLVYVDRLDQLRGIVNPHGVFTGTYMERIDIIQIVELLYSSTTVRNPGLEHMVAKVRALQASK